MQLSLRKTLYLCATYFFLEMSLNLVLKNTRRSSFLKQIPAGLLNKSTLEHGHIRKYKHSLLYYWIFRGAIISNWEVTQNFFRRRCAILSLNIAHLNPEALPKMISINLGLRNKLKRMRKIQILKFKLDYAHASK